MVGATATLRSGVLCMLGAQAGLIVSDSAIRWMTSSSAVPLPISEAMVFRGLVAIPGLLLIGLLIPAAGGLRIRDPGLFVLRGALMATTNLGFFLGLGLLPYAQSLGLFFVAPLLITLFSTLWLRERAGFREWGAVLLGGAGVVVMLRPFGEDWQWTGVFPLAAAAGYALMQTLTRRTRSASGPAEMALSAHLGIFVASVAFGAIAGGGGFVTEDAGELGRLLLGAWVWPAWEHLVLSLLCGTSVALAASLLFQGYRLAPAAVISPLEYIHLPLAALSGYLIWAEVPDQSTLLGIGLIVVGGIVILIRPGRVPRGTNWNEIGSQWRGGRDSNPRPPA